MKSEPDRLDLLIVALPLILLAILSMQIYHFVQGSKERAPGAALAREVIAMTSQPPAPAAGAELEETNVGETEPSPEGDAPQEPGTAGAEADAVAAPGDVAEPVAGDSQPEVPSAAAGSAPAPVPALAGVPGNAVPAPKPGGPAGTPNVVTSPGNAGSGSTGGGGGGGGGSAPPAGARGAARLGSRDGTGSASPTPVAGALITAPSQQPSATDEPAPEPAPSRSTALRGSAAVPDDTGASQPQVDPQQPAQITAVPAVNPVRVGQVLDVQILMQNGVNVASVPFYLQYDSNILKLDDSRGERGPALQAPGVNTQFLVTPGPRGNDVIVGLSLMGATRGVDGGGLLATIRFLALKPGQSELTFSHATVRGPDAGILLSTFVPGSVTVVD